MQSFFWRICLELFPSVEAQMKAMDCFRGKPYFYSRDQPSSCPAFSVVSSAKISSIRIPEIFPGEVPCWSANKLGLLKMLKKQFAKVYEKWHPPRIIGPSYRGVWLCIAGFKDLQTTSFEIPWFLGSIWRMQRSGMKSPGWMIMFWNPNGPMYISYKINVYVHVYDSIFYVAMYVHVYIH